MATMARFERQLELFIQRSRECGCRNDWRLHRTTVVGGDGEEASVYAKTLTRLGSYSLEVHIVPSPVYNVPMLFFTPTTNNGQSDDFEAILASIFGQDHLPAAMPCGLEEHPLFRGCLFWCLHPCRTAQLMGEMMVTGHLKDETFIASWLSIYGRPLGLDVPMGMFT